MRLLIVLFVCMVQSVWAANINDNRIWWSDTFDSHVTTGCLPAVPASSLTIAAFSCKAYAEDSGQWHGIDQAAAAITIADATPTWLAIHRSLSTTVAGWTRPFGTHYLYQTNATQPADPSGGVVFAKVTVAASVISAIEYVATYRYSATETIGAAATYGTASSVIVVPGGLLAHGSNALVLNGAFDVTPELRAIFTGAGTLTFGDAAITRVKPEWCGAIANDVTVGAANKTAIDKCAVNGGAELVQFSAGTYTVTGGITISQSGQIWQGVSEPGFSIIDETGAFPGLYILDAAGVKIRDIEVRGGTGTGGHGIHFRSVTNNVGNALVSNVRARNSGGDGIRYEGGDNARFETVDISGNTGAGFRCGAGGGAFGSAVNLELDAVDASSNGTHGFHFGTSAVSPDCNEILCAGCVAELNGASDKGFQVHVGNFTCIKCGVEGGSNVGFNFESTSSNVACINCVVQAVSADGIMIQMDGVTLINPNTSDTVSGDGIEVATNINNAFIINPLLGTTLIRDTVNNAVCQGACQFVTETVSDPLTKLGDNTRVRWGTAAVTTTIEEFTRSTDDVTNVAKVLTRPITDRVNLLLVYGQEQGGTRKFGDLVIAGRLATPVTIQGIDIQGSPTTRSYTMSGSQEVQLTMGAAETYDIIVYRIEPGNPAQ